MKPGEATRKVKEEFSKLKKYYLPTKCYRLLEDGERREIPCESVQELLMEGTAKEDVEVCNERLGKCVAIKKGEEVAIIEVEGTEIFLSKDEGEGVGKWEKIGYIVTGKGESRTIKTPVEGKILFIQEVLGEKASRYRIFIKKG